MRTLILNIKGGFVCALRVYMISKGEAYTECGNKHYTDTAKVSWGEPKCDACKKVIAIKEDEKKAMDAFFGVHEKD